MKIMGFTESGPIAGKVVEVFSPQYPGQKVSYRVTCIEGYEGLLDEGDFIQFDQNKWDYILKEWRKILEARKNIQNTLKTG